MKKNLILAYSLGPLDYTLNNAAIEKYVKPKKLPM